MSPLVPDDVTHALLGLGLRPTGAFGPSGGWLACDAAGALLELAVRQGVPGDPGAARLTGLRHDHLLPVRAVVPLDAGRAIGLLVGSCPAVSLDAVRRARIPLTDGEAATVAIPLAGALSALHAAGLAYGPFGPADVLLTPEGMPLLAAPTRPFGAPDDDVRTLLTAVLGVMAPRMVALTTGGRGEWAGTPELREVLERLLSEGCSADQVVRACLDTVRPEPIRIPAEVTARIEESCGPIAPAPRDLGSGAGMPASSEPAGRGGRADALGRLRPPPRPAAGARGAASARLARLRSGGPTGGRSERMDPAGRADGSGRAAARRAERRRRRIGSAVVATVTLGVALAVLLRPVGAAEAGAATPLRDAAAQVAAAPQASGGSSGHADPVADRADPAGAAAALTRLRAVALASGTAGALDAVDVAGGPAREADGRLVASLDGARVDGLAADVQDASLLAGSTDGGAAEATVEVTAAMTPYSLVGPDGVATSVPGTAPRATTLTLRWTDDGWRVWSVSDPT